MNDSKKVLWSTVVVALVGWIAGLTGLALHWTDSMQGLPSVEQRLAFLELRLQKTPTDVLTRLDEVNLKIEAIYRAISPHTSLPQKEMSQVQMREIHKQMVANCQHKQCHSALESKKQRADENQNSDSGN